MTGVERVPSFGRDLETIGGWVLPDSDVVARVFFPLTLSRPFQPDDYISWEAVYPEREPGFPNLIRVALFARYCTLLRDIPAHHSQPKWFQH